MVALIAAESEVARSQSASNCLASGLFRGVAVGNVPMEQCNGLNDCLRVELGFRRIEDGIGRQFGAPRPHPFRDGVRVGLFRNILRGNRLHQSVFDVLCSFAPTLLEPVVGPFDCVPHFCIGSVDSLLLFPFQVEANQTAAADGNDDGHRPKNEHQPPIARRCMGFRRRHECTSIKSTGISQMASFPHLRHAVDAKVTPIGSVSRRIAPAPMLGSDHLRFWLPALPWVVATSRQTSA